MSCRCLADVIALRTVFLSPITTMKYALLEPIQNIVSTMYNMFRISCETFFRQQVERYFYSLHQTIFLSFIYSLS